MFKSRRRRYLPQNLFFWKIEWRGREWTFQCEKRGGFFFFEWWPLEFKSWQSQSDVSTYCEVRDDQTTCYFSLLLQKGKYCSRDDNHAAKRFKKGSVVGDSISMRWVGLCYCDCFESARDLMQVFTSVSDLVKASYLAERLCFWKISLNFSLSHLFRRSMLWYGYEINWS